jgi:hypothetical protein
LKAFLSIGRVLDKLGFEIQKQAPSRCEKPDCKGCQSTSAEEFHEFMLERYGLAEDCEKVDVAALSDHEYALRETYIDFLIAWLSKAAKEFPEYGEAFDECFVDSVYESRPGCDDEQCDCHDSREKVLADLRQYRQQYFEKDKQKHSLEDEVDEVDALIRDPRFAHMVEKAGLN